MKLGTNYTRIAELHAEGFDIRTIAAAVGCHPRTVERWRAANGLARESRPNSSKPLSTERRAAIAAMLDDGCSYNEIVATLHVSRGTLQRHFPGRGWPLKQSGQIAAMNRKLNALPDRLR